ncbi:hypothetical protein GWK41_02790 [Persephonella atlantica]|uniref:Uncharacterized protein n=1 Tax=Persephonella atlantica TaxID=2699429 RepID=A0ABS1GGG0_9AQUI|nr:hypothetical protein [Persephonella atlantica]MBK3331993.1 hypothetical protein [Persephonella atlantica]
MKNEDLMKNPFMTNMKFLQQAQDETEFQRILKILTVPSKSGFYLSRYDLRDIGRTLGVEIPIKERKEMLKDLFIYAKQMEQMKQFLDTIIQFINHRISQYQKITDEYPKSEKFMTSWIKKAKGTIQFLENMKKETDIYKNI